MWMNLAFRFLRKRIVLGIIFTASLIYCLSTIIARERHFSVLSGEPLPYARLPHRHFQWHREESSLGNSSESGTSVCRNSVQGKLIVADDRGFVCARTDLEPGGCCKRTLETTRRYVCDTCNQIGCCALYEYCISCCMQPDKKPLLEQMLASVQPGRFNVLYASVRDHFELCQTRCRTSSQSVHHENSYRDASAKHCYGASPADSTKGVAIPRGSASSAAGVAAAIAPPLKVKRPVDAPPPLNGEGGGGYHVL